MPVQRTPPPHLQKSTSSVPPISQNQPSPPQSPSSIFKPKSQPVRRSLPDGSLPPLPPSVPVASSSSSSSSALPPSTPQPALEAAPEEDEEMDVEEVTPSNPTPSSPHQPGPISPPPPVPAASASQFTTPKQSRRQSVKKTPAAVLEEPIPIPLEAGEDEEDYGKHYQVMLQALEVAVRKGANKWTANDLKQCFPILSARLPGVMESVWTNTAQAIRTNIMNEATTSIDQLKAGPALKLLNQTIQEAKEYSLSEQGSIPRPDRWRPDITPAALTVAYNLPIYEREYARLREEYISLHEECATRYTSISAKRAELSNLESSVSEGVEDLNKAITSLSNFPSEEMMAWTEENLSKSSSLRIA